MESWDIDGYELDVQHYIIEKMDCIDYAMEKGQTYVNSLGRAYIVLEDSPIGELIVKVKTDCPFGTAVRTVDKLILLS